MQRNWNFHACLRESKLRVLENGLAVACEVTYMHLPYDSAISRHLLKRHKHAHEKTGERMLIAALFIMTKN